MKNLTKCGSGMETDNRGGVGKSREFITTITISIICVVLILASKLISPSLGSWSQVKTVLIIGSFLTVVTYGQGLVVLSGGLDLSIPALITMGGVIATASFPVGGLWGDGLLIIFLIISCGLVGLFTAIGVVWLRVPAFIMTMATSIIVASAALGVTKGTPKGMAPELATMLMKSSVFGIPAVVIFLFVFVFFAWLLQERSSFGRFLYAVGTNVEAAKIAGVPITRIQIMPYVISAMCAGFAGFMLVGYANGATLRMGDDYLLTSIAAVVIGGSSILGGKGSFLGSVGGAFLLTILGTIISAIGINLGYRTVIEGVIILMALLLLREELFNKLRANRSRT